MTRQLVKDQAYVNAEARFHLPGFLHDMEADRLREIPGVQVWRKQPMVRCSFPAMGAVRPVVLHAVTASGMSPDDVLIEHDYGGPRPFSVPPCLPPGLWDGGGDLADNPTGLTLTKYQRQGIEHFVKLGGGLIEAPAGSGKTLVGDAAALASAPDLPSALLLTVCKASARVQQSREKTRFFGVDPFVLKPKALRRKSDRWQTWEDYQASWERGELPYGVRWLIVAWGAVTSHLDWLCSLGFDAVVLDESHYAKSADRVKFHVYMDEDEAGGIRFDREDKLNRSASTAKLCKTIPYRFQTTATPLSNRLHDWWALANLIERPGEAAKFGFDAWGPTVSKFLIRYCNGVSGEWGGIVTQAPHYSNISEFRTRIKYTRFVVPYSALAEQLPPCKRRVQQVPADAQDKPMALSKADRAAYKAILKDAHEHERRASVAGGDAEATAGLDASKERLTTLRLHDACNRKRTATADVVKEYTDSAASRPGDKPGAFDRTIPRGKVLVFFGLRRALDNVARKIRKTCDTVWVADGGRVVKLGKSPKGTEDEVSDIETMKDEYMNHPGPAVIVGTYQYIGESHNLQDSDAIVVGMLPYTAAMVAQIVGRGARLGQMRPLDVVFMCAEGTADDRLRELIIDKLPAIEVLGDGAHGLDGLSRTLRGIDDLDGLLASFADAMLAG